MPLRHTLPLAFLLCACAAPPKPAVPDGSQRSPVNTQEGIDAYLEHTKQSRLTAQAEPPAHSASRCWKTSCATPGNCWRPGPSRTARRPARQRPSPAHR